jgi:hypothetical protein
MTTRLATLRVTRTRLVVMLGADSRQVAGSMIQVILSRICAFCDFGQIDDAILVVAALGPLRVHN